MRQGEAVLGQTYALVPVHGCHLSGDFKLLGENLEQIRDGHE